MGKVNDLGHDKIRTLILKLAIPAMLAQFVSVLYGIVDRIFIAGIPDIGITALAGVGVCAPILAVASSFSFLVGVSGAPLFAMKMGAKREQDAKQIMSNCLIMLIFVSIIITIVFFFARKPMLLAFGASENTIKYADSYFSVFILGSIFAIVSMGLNSFITAQGYAKQSMFTVLIGAVLNLILDPLFIFTFKMGVAGAALATIISQAVSCVWVILFLISKKSIVKLSFRGFSIRLCFKIIKLGISPFVITATDGVVLILFNTMLKKYGGANGDLFVGAGTIALSFMQIVTLPMGGITLGCQPIISYNYGADNKARVKSAFWGVNIICLVFTAIMFLIAMFLPHVFASIFTSDPQTLDISVKAIRICSSGIIFLALQYAGVDCLTALGKAGRAIILSLTRKVVIMTTLIFILPYFFGALFVFWAMPIADTIGAIITFLVATITFGNIFNETSIKKKKDNKPVLR